MKIKDPWERNLARHREIGKLTSRPIRQRKSDMEKIILKEMERNRHLNRSKELYSEMSI